MDEITSFREKKYRNDTVFQKINKKYLTLSQGEIRISNEHLKTVIEKIFIPLMLKDKLFAVMYRRIMYGGSYYKRTKYGRPEEFDLDMIIELPISYRKIRIDTDHENYGFIKIKVDTQGPLRPDWVKHSNILSKWITYDGYLDQNKFRAWMESVFTMAFNQLSKNSRGSYEMKLNGMTYLVTHKKSGPAFTLRIFSPNRPAMDVDLVPCFEFDYLALGNGYTRLNGNRKTWLAVAKPLDNITNSNVLWRLCFYEHEKDFLKGDLKPVIRMMKKFRDTRKWNSIASYYIETIYYHEIERNLNNLEAFLRAPKTCLFMIGLKRLRDALANHNLPYFWHSNCNLLGKISRPEIQGYVNNLTALIKRIDNTIEKDPFVLADVVLGDAEARLLRQGSIAEDMANLRVTPELPEESHSLGIISQIFRLFWG